MVSKSGEIRWWAKEKAEMWDWFQENVLKTRNLEPKQRTDYYLKSIDNRTTVKWREGNLEFKFRTSTREMPTGLMEEYLKESLPSELNRNILPVDAMIPVRKKRYQRIIRPSTGLITEADTFADEGCQIEFTEVRISNQKTIYSICFEAYSKSRAESAVLNETLNLFRMNEDFFSLENSGGFALKIERAHLKK